MNIQVYIFFCAALGVSDVIHQRLAPNESYTISAQDASFILVDCAADGGGRILALSMYNTVATLGTLAFAEITGDGWGVKITNKTDASHEYYIQRVRVFK